MYGDGWWRENLRMTRDTFEILCNELRPYIERQDTRYRKSVSVEVRVAVTIWRLGTNIEYRTIAALFGLGRSTACEIVLDTCEVIARHLMPKYVRVPKNESLQEIIDSVHCRWGFPQTVGAIDGIHIPILRPQESASDYYNWKGYYSILMQEVLSVGESLLILISGGWGMCMMPVFL